MELNKLYDNYHIKITLLQKKAYKNIVSRKL